MASEAAGLSGVAADVTLAKALLRVVRTVVIPPEAWSMEGIPEEWGGRGEGRARSSDGNVLAGGESCPDGTSHGVYASSSSAPQAVASSGAPRARASSPFCSASWPPPASDLHLLCGGLVFRAHAPLLGGRSAFFSSLLSWGAGDDAPPPAPARRALEGLRAWTLAAVLEWLYADRLRVLPAALLPEALGAAEALMLPELRPLVVAQAAGALRRANLVEAFALGELYAAPRLTAAAAALAARLLDEVLADPEFEELVRRDAAAIAGRQDADSLPVLDELRSAILAREGGDAERDVRVLGEYVARLGLRGARV